jgi:hypothetical protein
MPWQREGSGMFDSNLTILQQLLPFRLCIFMPSPLLFHHGMSDMDYSVQIKCLDKRC